MNPEKVRTLPLKANGADNIQLVTEFIDPRYRDEVLLKRSATPSGWLVLFRISPLNGFPLLPGFVGRWENPIQAVDVDPDPIDCIDRDQWRGETNGYRGHHAHRFSNDPRIYQIDLHTPAGPVFKGLLRFNVELGMWLQDGFGVTVDATFSATVV